MRYQPCAGCKRHVRESECPFCGHVNVLAMPDASPAPRAFGLTRAAIVLGTVAALPGVGCGSQTPVAPAYGGPPVVQEAPPAPAPTQEQTAADPPPAPEAAYGGAPAYGGPPAVQQTPPAVPSAEDRRVEEERERLRRAREEANAPVALYGAVPFDE